MKATVKVMYETNYGEFAGRARVYQEYVVYERGALWGWNRVAAFDVAADAIEFAKELANPTPDVQVWP